MSTTVEELAELSVSPAPEAPLAEPIPRLSRPTLFKLVFGHSLWGAPIFEAAHGERIPQFNVTSFAEPDIDCSVATTKLGWIQPNSTFPTPRPGSGLVALSAANVVELLRRGEADVGALPGNIVPSDFIRVGTVVDSVAGCTFVCEDDKFQQWKKRLFLQDEKVTGQHSGGANRPDTGVVSTSHLAHILQTAKVPRRGIRVAAEADTVAFRFLQDACQQSGLLVKDVRWDFPTKDLAGCGFNEMKRRCHAQEKAELLGVIVWEPHATWMKMVEGEKSHLRKIPLHLTPNRLGRPHHYSYEIVVRDEQLQDRNPRRQELVNAIAKLMYELDVSAERLNGLSWDGADENILKRLAHYYGMVNPADGSPMIEWTLGAVGSILYSVRWLVRGRDWVR
jgi:hypothetical protein